MQASTAANAKSMRADKSHLPPARSLRARLHPDLYIFERRLDKYLKHALRLYMTRAPIVFSLKIHTLYGRMFADDVGRALFWREERARCIIIKIKPAFMALSFPPDFLVFHIRGGPDLAARKATRGSHSPLSRECDTFCSSSVKMSTYRSGENRPPLFGAADGKLKQRSFYLEKSTSFFIQRAFITQAMKNAISV